MPLCINHRPLYNFLVGMQYFLFPWCFPDVLFSKIKMKQNYPFLLYVKKPKLNNLLHSVSDTFNLDIYLYTYELNS